MLLSFLNVINVPSILRLPQKDQYLDHIHLVKIRFFKCDLSFFTSLAALYEIFKLCRQSLPFMLCVQLSKAFVNDFWFDHIAF